MSWSGSISIRDDELFGWTFAGIGAPRNTRTAKGNSVTQHGMLWVSLVETGLLPFLGLATLFGSKLVSGPWARTAERGFFGVLIAVAIITCRTVVTLDDCWLLHTSTLGVMIVGALSIPDRDSFDHRRAVRFYESI